MDTVSEDDENHFKGFQVELSYRVRDRFVSTVEVIYNETFDNEKRVTLRGCTPTSVYQILGGSCCMDVSALTFLASGEIEFCILFSGPSTGVGLHQHAFLEHLWALSLLEFSVDIESSCKELANDFVWAMERLRTCQSSSEIEATEYFLLLF